MPIQHYKIIIFCNSEHLKFARFLAFSYFFIVDYIWMIGTCMSRDKRFVISCFGIEFIGLKRL